MPLFFVLMMGVVDFGMALRAYVTVTNATREGARIGVVCGGQTTWSAAQTPIAQTVVDKSNGLVSSGDVTLLVDGTSPSGNCTSGQEVSVHSTYTYSYITPLGSLFRLLSGYTLPDSLPLSSTTRMRVE